jgi:RNA polymerase sigma-70 factor (ECF subfamily)
VTGSAVFPWAVAIARRLVIDAARSERRDTLAYADGAVEVADIGGGQGDGFAEATELAARLQRRLVLLPESQRQAFELMRFDGLSHADAARTLGITVTALKLRAHRAYSSLRVALSAGDGA